MRSAADVYNSKRNDEYFFKPVNVLEYWLHSCISSRPSGRYWVRIEQAPVNGELIKNGKKLEEKLRDGRTRLTKAEVKQLQIGRIHSGHYIRVIRQRESGTRTTASSGPSSSPTTVLPLYTAGASNGNGNGGGSSSNVLYFKP